MDFFSKTMASSSSSLLSGSERDAGGAHTHAAWSNDTVVLPQQQTSWIAYAAQSLESNYYAVPRPLDADKLVMPNEKYRHATHMQMRLFQDAHASLNSLVVLGRMGEVERVIRSERAEIEAAALGLTPPDNTAPPRMTSVAVLVDLTRDHPKVKMLLDAAAYLARAVSMDGRKSRATTSTRMLFLAGSSAKAYALRQQAQALKTHSKFASGNSEVCVTWAEPVPTTTTATTPAAGETWTLRSEFAQLKHCATARDYAKSILKLIHETWAVNNFVPEPTRLLDAYDWSTAAPVDGAYVRGVVECAEDFWSLVKVKGQVRLSRYVQEMPEFDGLSFAGRQFVKVVPRPQSQGERELPPQDPCVYHALLLHRRDKDADCKAWCETIKFEEAERARQEGRPVGAFGLRPPQTSQEEAICPHLLMMTPGHRPLDNNFTTYGLMAAPGESLSGNTGFMPQLTYEIVPLAHDILSRAYLLPATQVMCNPTVPMLKEPMWRAFDDAIQNCYEVFGGGGDTGTTASTINPQSPTAVAACAPRAQGGAEQLVTGPPATEEEKMLGVLLGTPLGCSAFCIGDIYNVLQHERVTQPVSAFLLAAAAKLGNDDSLSSAFNYARTAMLRVDQEAEAHNEEVSTLKRKLDDATLTIETLNNVQAGRRVRASSALLRSSSDHVHDSEERAEPAASAALPPPLPPPPPRRRRASRDDQPRAAQEAAECDWAESRRRLCRCGRRGRAKLQLKFAQAALQKRPGRHLSHARVCSQRGGECAQTEHRGLGQESVQGRQFFCCQPARRPCRSVSAWDVRVACAL